MWGRRDWTSAPFRQQFRCVPADGSTPHTFSLGRRRASDAHGAGEECLTCDVKPGVARGRSRPRTTSTPRSRSPTCSNWSRRGCRSGAPAGRPMEATVAPGRKTASIKATGMMLTDFPLVLRDWDSVANDRLASSVKAGSGYKAHWGCHRCGHTWEAEVAQRAMRQTRCQRCSTERADGLNALASVRPDLVREWDTTANAPLRPDKIKATYDKAVRWICPDDPEHPGYKMSPFTRATLPVGCPLCRRKAKAQERRVA